MLHIADTKMARRYGDFFIRQIHKLEEVCIDPYSAVKYILLYVQTTLTWLPNILNYQRRIEKLNTIVPI